jgi:acyl dehydratase
MKIPVPVRIGDTIRVHAKVKEKSETKNPSRGIIKFFWEIKNQKDESVMTLDYVLMIHRRP